MTKFIAKTLSIIVFLTAIAINYNVTMLNKIVYANTNDINFNTSFTKALDVGPTDSVPINRTVTGDDSVWFEWDMNNFNESSFTTGNFLLSYPLEDGLEVRFEVEKTADDVANVQYKIYDLNATPPTQVNSSNYSIYSHAINNYVSLNDFINNGYNSSVPNYKVIDNSGVDPIGYPQFIVGPNYGFSFKYNNVSLHFKWEESGDLSKMYFYTNQLKKGYIVEPNLNVQVGATSKDYKKVITSGLSSAGFTVVPYANENKYSSDVISVTSEVDKFPANDEEDRGLDVTFKKLKAWDSTTNMYTAEPDFAVPVTVRFVSLKDKESMTVTVDDIYSVSPTINLVTTNTEVGWSNFTVTPDEVAYKLTGLGDGIIYETTIDVLPDLTETDEQKRLISNSTGIPFGEVFTFPKYEVISQNNKLYIVSQPFYGYAGEFLLKTGISEKVSARKESDGQSQLIFPLSINSENMFSEYFRLYFSTGKVFEDTASANTTNTIHSQKLYYEPQQSTDLVTIPNNFYVVDYNHIKDDTVSDLNKGFLEVTYRWDIGLKSNIDEFLKTNSEISVDYKLSKTLTPDAGNLETVSNINVLIKDTNGEGNLEVEYSGGDGTGENYVINTEVEKLNSKYQQDSGNDVYYAEVTLLFKTANVEYSGADTKEIYFRYPNIYFFTIDPLVLNGNDINVSGSVFRPVTLNYLEEPNLKPPQNVSLEDNTFLSKDEGDTKDETSFKTIFNLSGDSMNMYLNSSYASDEIDKVLDEDKFKAYFNVYISENESIITNELMQMDYEERKNNSSEVLYDESFNNTVYLSNINGNAGEKTTEGEDAIEVLRNGEVLKISEYPINKETLQNILNTSIGKSYAIKLDGLDTNTKYYVVLDTVIEDLEKDFLDYSDLSPINAITTKSKLETLKPGENDPNAPDVFEIETKTDNTIIGWQPIIPEVSEDVTIDIEYEIIRLKTNPMLDEHLDTRENFDTTFNELVSNSDKVGFKTNNSNVLIYNNTEFVVSDATLYNYNIDGTPLTFQDNTLVPNNIYYYYVRTVKTIDGDELYSVWERVAVTTTNIDGPINLTAMFDEYDSNIDLKEEVYLKFDAPIKDLTQLGTVYNLQLSILKDGEEWQQPITMNANSFITDNVIDSDGYRSFIYKVTNLEPATSYTFRVRLQLIEQGTSSLYSNTVRIRTDAAQDDYDEKEKIDSWEDYVKDKLEEILNGNYWEISDEYNNREIVYREGKFDGMLKTVDDGFLNLVEATPNKFNHYYIPVASLMKCNNDKIGLKIKSGNTSVSLSSSAIDTSLNNALKPLSESLKNGDIKDYYVKLVVKTEDSVQKINGNSISSPIIETSIVTKAFDMDIQNFEYEVYEVLQQKFLDETLTEDIIEEIEDLIEDEKSNEDIIRSLGLDVQKYAEDAMEDISDLFHDNKSAEKYNREVTILNSPILISNSNENISNTTGYKQVGTNWIKVQTSAVGLNDLIVTNTTGTYVFVGTKVIINDVGNIEDATKVHEVLIKYDLYDILKSPAGIEASNVVTRDEAYSSVAKILGNQNETSVSYLKDLGIDVTTRNLNNVLKEDELTYLLMNVYEYKTSSSINNYQIKNFSAMSKISSVNSKYLKSVQVAVDLGIINLNDFDANNEVTVESFLNTILSVGDKIGI